MEAEPAQEDDKRALPQPQATTPGDFELDAHTSSEGVCFDKHPGSNRTAAASRTAAFSESGAERGKRSLTTLSLSGAPSSRAEASKPDGASRSGHHQTLAEACPCSAPTRSACTPLLTQRRAPPNPTTARGDRVWKASTIAESLKDLPSMASAEAVRIFCRHPRDSGRSLPTRGHRPARHASDRTGAQRGGAGRELCPQSPPGCDCPHSPPGVDGTRARACLDEVPGRVADRSAARACGLPALVSGPHDVAPGEHGGGNNVDEFVCLL